MAQATSNYQFRLDDEPGSVKPAAVINLLKLSTKRASKKYD